MASIPLPALDIKPPAQPINPMDQYAKALQVKGMMQQQQMGAVQLQQAQQQQQDQKTLGQLMIKNNGNLDKVIQDAPQAGVMPNTVLQLQAHSLDVKQKIQTLSSDQLKNFSAVHDNAAGLTQAVLDASTPEAKDAAYQAGLQKIQANPQMYGLTDPSQIPQQRPPDDVLKTQLALNMGQKEQAAQAMKQREVVAQEQTAQGRLMQGQAAQQKTAPMPPPKISFLNQQLSSRYQVLNPGQPLPPQFSLQQNATRQDYEDADKALEQVEKAQGVKAQQDTANSMRAQAAATAKSAADDRSDKLGREPVIGQDKTGNTVLVSAADAKTMGLTGQMKADTDLVNKAQAGRDWLKLATNQAPADATPDKMGIMQLVNKMDAEGKLGVLTSRWSDFMAGKVGAGDSEFSALRAKMGLSTTKLMQAHVGSRGGAFMLEHFEDLANAGKMDAPTLKSALASEVDYVKDVAKMPQQNQGSATPAPQTHSFSLGAWQKANPKGDPNAAKAAAQAQGYTVTP